MAQKVSELNMKITNMFILLFFLIGQQSFAAINETGEIVYKKWCVDCHGSEKGYYGVRVPGTDALKEKYKGQIPAVLTERKDLQKDYVKYVVRNGVSIMPFFRKTEISDIELEKLAIYLSNR